jgi:hypothetical protein
VPFDKPSGETEDEGPGGERREQRRRGEGWDSEFVLRDGVWEEDDASRGNPIFVDAAREVRGDSGDETGAAEENAVCPAGDGGEQGLGANAGIADQLIYLDHEGAFADRGNEGGREEEEGVALVDEVAIVAAGETEVSREGGDVVEELEKLEEGWWEKAGQAGEETGIGFDEGGGAGGLAGVRACGAGEDDAVAHFLEGADDAGDVDGLGAGATGAKVVEDGHWRRSIRISR